MTTHTSLEQSDLVEIRFRFPSGTIETRKLSIHTTISELRTILHNGEVTADTMRLVYAGRVLNDNEATLASYSLKEGATIYVVRNASKPTPAISPEALARADPNAVQDQDPFSSMLQSTLFKTMFSNTELVKSMLLNHPQMQKLMETNTSIRHMIEDPSFLESLMNSRKPQLMREMMRNNDRALSNIEAMPGGMNHLQRMYKSVQEPMYEMERMGAMNDPLSDLFSAYLQSLANSDEPETGPNTRALPNPWQRDRNQDLISNSMFPPTSSPSFLRSNRPGLVTNPFNQPWEMGSIGNPFRHATQRPVPPRPRRGTPIPIGDDHSVHGLSPRSSASSTPKPESATSPQTPRPKSALGGTSIKIHEQNTNTQMPEASTTQSTANSTRPERHLYPEQLEQMRGMGFTDEERNARALLLTGGDLNSAVEWLLRTDTSHQGTS